MAATAKQRRATASRGVPLELKQETAASESAAIRGALAELQTKAAKTLADMESVLADRAGEKGTKTGVDPLTEVKSDKAISEGESLLERIRAAHRALEAKRAEVEDLEIKSQRPPTSGRASLDGNEVETKSADTFQLEWKSAFEEYARSGRTDGYRGLVDQYELKDMSTLSDPDGGYFVREDMDLEIQRVITERGGFRTLCEVSTTSAKSGKKRVNLGSTGAGWVGEKESRPKTETPTFEEIEWQTGELYARPAVTQQELEDSYIDIEELLAQEVAIQFDVKEADAFINGDGQLGKPRGLLSYPFATSPAAWGQFGYLKTGVAGGLPSTADGDEYVTLVEFQHKLKRAYRGQASWIMTDTTKALLRKVRDADGRPLLVDSPLNGGITTLLEKPIHEVDEMAEAATNGYAIGWGDWRSTYRIMDRLGTSMDRFYDSNTAPYVEFYTRKRVGGFVKMFESAWFLKFAA